MKAKVTKKTPVTKVVPVAKAAEVAATPAPKATNVVAVSKYKGRTTGMRVMEFQDTMFAANVKAMLTDEELAAAWRDEFPHAVSFTTNHVTGARRDYNNGTHCKSFARPDAQLDAVVLVDGKRLWAGDVKAVAVATPKAKAPEAAPVAPKTPTVKANVATTARVKKTRLAKSA